jgi:hypothetical protein
MRALKPDLLLMTDLSEILFLIKLKHVNRDEDKDLKHSSSEEEGSSSRGSSSCIGNNDTSYSVDEPIMSKIKGVLNKIVEGKPSNSLSAADFSNNQVWTKLIILAESEWTHKLNETYLNELLTRFDADNL